MASTALKQSHRTTDKKSKTKHAMDQEILEKPYAEALLFMGHKPESIVYAVKLLQQQKKALEVGSLLTEIENLESKGRPMPPLETDSVDRKDPFGSDGESDSGSDEGESLDTSPTIALPNSDDLQMDCEDQVNGCAMMQQASVQEIKRPSSLPAKDREALEKKLQALRMENQKLKERQLCKDCHSQPVSITFLPCGHYSYCYDCGQKFSTCPICRRTILADVRTFLA